MKLMLKHPNLYLLLFWNLIDQNAKNVQVRKMTCKMQKFEFIIIFDTSFRGIGGFIHVENV